MTPAQLTSTSSRGKSPMSARDRTLVANVERDRVAAGEIRLCARSIDFAARRTGDRDHGARGGESRPRLRRRCRSCRRRRARPCPRSRSLRNVADGVTHGYAARGEQPLDRRHPRQRRDRAEARRRQRRRGVGKRAAANAIVAGDECARRTRRRSNRRRPSHRPRRRACPAIARARVSVRDEAAVARRASARRPRAPSAWHAVDDRAGSSTPNKLARIVEARQRPVASRIVAKMIARARASGHSLSRRFVS